MPRSKRASGPAKNFVAWVLLALLIVGVGFFTYSILKSPTKTSPKRTSKEKISSPKQPSKSPPKKSPAKKSEKPIGKIRVLVRSLNLRSSPNVGNNVIGSLKKDTILSVLSKKDTWYEVITPQDKKGFVSSNKKYIQVIEMEE